MTEPTLFDDDRPAYAQDEIGERFWSFHLAHPFVYDALVRLALDWQRTGHGRCGMKMLWERLRWELLTSADFATLGERPALDNRYTSRYARLLMDDPRFRGMFETRALKAA